MSNIYRPERWHDYFLPETQCPLCMQLKEENRDLLIQVQGLKMTLEIVKRAILFDYEWRGFPDAEDYFNELIIAQVEREGELVC